MTSTLKTNGLSQNQPQISFPIILTSGALSPLCLCLHSCIRSHGLLRSLRCQASFLLCHLGHQSKVIDIEGRSKCVINDDFFVCLISKGMRRVRRNDNIVTKLRSHFLISCVEGGGALQDEKGFIVHLIVASAIGNLGICLTIPTWCQCSGGPLV